MKNLLRGRLHDARLGQPSLVRLRYARLPNAPAATAGGTSRRTDGDRAALTISPGLLRGRLTASGGASHPIVGLRPAPAATVGLPPLLKSSKFHWAVLEVLMYKRVHCGFCAPAPLPDTRSLQDFLHCLNIQIPLCGARVARVSEAHPGIWGRDWGGCGWRSRVHSLRSFTRATQVDCPFGWG